MFFILIIMLIKLFYSYIIVCLFNPTFSLERVTCVAYGKMAGHVDTFWLRATILEN